MTKKKKLQKLEEVLSILSEFKDDEDFYINMLASNSKYHINSIKFYLERKVKEKPKRFSHSTVGYGVVSLMGEHYRMGRIEIFDKENDNGFATSEGFYCLPHQSAMKFEDFIDSLTDDLPLHIEMGTMEWCQNEVAKLMGIPADKLNDSETKKQYYKNKTNEGTI